ncbi:MAG: T9SS type A sorting domain-containing protein [Bacteroidetes bacterium]|nr:T9SS type A sorting domain-containing protein [Bacteroidota bacterium]MBL7103737.1 T9SS type A sorting domain-containing protein [Bacteroidales bacterium]
MKTLLTILSIIILFSEFLFGQNMEITWQQCFGGSENDHAYDIIVIQNGYLIAGSTKSNDGNISYNHGATDGWLLKTNIIGELLWEKTYGGTNGDGIFRIFPADGNNFFLLCSSYSSNGDISYDPFPESTDFWIVKIDSSGNILWDKIVGGNGLDQMWTGTPTNDGGVVALGWSGSEYGDVSVNYGLYDIWMIKLNSEGEIGWDFTIGTDWQDYGQAIIQTSDGGFLVGGSSKLTGGGNLNCETHGQADGVLIKLDSLRNIEWQQCYGGSDYDGVWELMELVDGYLFVGYASSNDGDISGWHGEGDIWTVKIDYYGNIIWQKCLGGSRYEYATNVFQESDGGFKIVGMTESHDGDVSGNHTLSEYDNDIWMVKLSSDGELLWQQCIGGEGDDRLDFGVVKKSDNNFVIAGQTNLGPSYDVECDPYAIIYPDYWIFEIKDTSTNIINTQTTDNAIKVYPNPAMDYVVFETSLNPPNCGKCKLIVSDVFGQMLTTLHLKNEKTVWDIREVSSGTYFYYLQSGLNAIERGKIVILK